MASGSLSESESLNKEPVASDDARHGSCKVGEVPQSGMLASCRLLVRGVVKITEIVVVQPGAWQSVIACPADCAISISGDWAETVEEGSWQVVPCDCEDPDAQCGVVFYAVDTKALDSRQFPDATSFKTLGGNCTRPLHESLLRLVLGNVDAADPLRIQSLLSEESATSQNFDEVCIGYPHSLLVTNSIVTIPDFLSREECHILIDAADRNCHGGSSAGNFYSYQKGMNRFPVCKLDFEAQLLSTSIVKDRLLSWLEQHVPLAAETMFGRSSDLKKLKFCFSPGEPAVNRYVEGGGIAPHLDHQAITLNVLLSDFGAFQGGGTIFWPEDQANQEMPEDIDCDRWRDMVLLRPHQGTAILFNGNTLLHAGKPVVSGIRHTFVASFNLFSLDEY